jgi:hypothetical protein
MTRDNIDTICGMTIAISVVGFLCTIFCGVWLGTDNGLVETMFKVSVSVFVAGATSSIISHFFNFK